MADIFKADDATTPGHYLSSQTALLLLDFHTLFVEHAGGPAAPASLAVASQMRTWAHSHNIPVIHALVDLHTPPFPTCKDLDRFASIVETMRSSGGGAESPDLLVASEGEDITFTRRAGFVSALKSPGLEDYLRSKKIKSLVLAGLSTSGCVLRTALAACDAEFVVTVLSDGCADPDPAVHEVAVTKLLANRGFVATAAEFREGFDKVQGGR